MMKNTTAEYLAAFISSLPENFIKEITFLGHGNFNAIEMNTDNHDFLGWWGDMDGPIRLGSGDNFTNLLGPKLGNNA